MKGAVCRMPDFRFKRSVKNNSRILLIRHPACGIDYKCRQFLARIPAYFFADMRFTPSASIRQNRLGDPIMNQEQGNVNRMDQRAFRRSKDTLTGGKMTGANPETSPALAAQLPEESTPADRCGYFIPRLQARRSKAEFAHCGS